MIISGINTITELIKANKKIEKVIISKNFSKDKNQNLIEMINNQKIILEELNNNDFLRLSKAKNTQNIIAFVPEYKFYDLNEFSKSENVFLVILDNIEDPHNLGSIIRTCECAGVDAIIIPSNRACQINETVYRTSAGAISNMPIIQVVNINESIRQLKKQNVWVYGFEANGKDMYSSNLTGKIALVIGSEGFGINKLTQSLCDEILSIPMFGKTNSLNASNAAAVGIYEAIRQRTKND